MREKQTQAVLAEMRRPAVNIRGVLRDTAQALKTSIDHPQDERHKDRDEREDRSPHGILHLAASDVADTTQGASIGSHGQGSQSRRVRNDRCA